jgi:hypothetical protein
MRVIAPDHVQELLAGDIGIFRQAEGRQSSVCPAPAKMLGQGRPMNDGREPSVPLRMRPSAA